MLNKDKIRIMTKLAVYEQNEGKKDLPLSKYFKSDYMTVKMINSAITMSIGFVLLLATTALMNLEKILSDMVRIDLISFGLKILTFYVIAFVINMVVTYIIYSYKFKKSRANLKSYNNLLKELYKIYKQEENSNEGNFFKDDFSVEDIHASQYADNRMTDFGGIDDDEIVGN